MTAALNAPPDESRHSDRETRLIIEHMPGFAWSAGQDGKLRYVNPRFLEFTGQRIEDVARTEVLHPEDVERNVTAWSHAVATGEPYLVEHRVRRFDGTYRWFRVAAARGRDSSSQELRWYGVDLDVDDQKRTDDALRESEQRLTQLIETLPAMVWRATPDWVADCVNRRWVTYTGLSLSEWNSCPIHPDDAQKVSRAFALATASATGLEFTARVRGADGSYRWFETRVEPVRDEAGRVVHWFGIEVDVDDRKRAEDALHAAQAQLARASEIANVSGVAASIAHEISQPLAAMVANGHACQRWLAADPPNLDRAQLAAERIVRDGTSAAEVVSRIRALFKRTEVTRTLVNLNDVVGEVSRLMADEMADRNIRIDTALADDLPPVWADAVQMQQVIANLARNGVDAMKSEAGHPKVLAIRSRRDGPNNVLIEIRDQGSGLDDLEKVFEPFFTTKAEGMGMGLAICRWIVEAHEGRLWAAHNSPRGAVFSFTLPISSRESR